MKTENKITAIDVIVKIVDAVYSSNKEIDLFGQAHETEDDTRAFNDLWIRKNVNAQVLLEFRRISQNESAKSNIKQSLSRIGRGWIGYANNILDQNDPLSFFNLLFENGLITNSGITYVTATLHNSDPAVARKRAVNDFIYNKSGIDKNKHKAKKLIGLLLLEFVCMVIHIITISTTNNPIAMGIVGLAIAVLHIKVFFYFTKLYTGINYFNYRTVLCGLMLIAPYVYYIGVM